MVLVHVHRFPNKQNHTRNPPKRNQLSTHNLPKRHQPSARNPPKRTVGAVPACPPERPRSDVFIREIGFVHHALCAGNLTMDAPLQGDTGGHTGTAPTHLHHIFPCNPTQTKFRPCAIHPYQSPPNHTVCHYPIGVILSIAQGWQVQRSLPWVMM